MSSKEHPIIIFLDRSGFIMYQDSLSNVWQFTFSQDLVQNLDVVNKDQLVNSIGSFIQTNKIGPSSIIVILSDSVIFQKDLSSVQKNPESPQTNQQKPQIDFGYKEQQEKEIKNFLDNVPFEEILAKVINNTRLVATNKDLVEAIISPFKKIGCSVDTIVPGFMYQQYIDFSGGLSQDIARLVLQQADLLKLGNMLTGQQAVAVETQQGSSEHPQEAPKEKPNNLRQFILMGVFVFLLIVLAIVYLTLGKTPQAPSQTIVSQSLKSLNGPTPASALRVKPITSQETSVSPSEIDLKNITITIVVNQETEGIESALKNLLTQSGFQNITIRDSTNPISARSSVLFSKSVPDSIRQKAILEIKKIFPDILIQESQDLESMITIIVGKSV